MFLAVTCSAALLTFTEAQIRDLSIQAAQTHIASVTGSDGSAFVQTQPSDGPTPVLTSVAADLRQATGNGTAYVIGYLSVGDLNIDANGVQSVGIAVADSAIADDTRLLAGAWPDRGETALQANAAKTLNLSPGDRVTIGEAGTVFTVSGLWEPDDPLAPRWAGQPEFTSGHRGEEIGPYALSSEDLSLLSRTPKCNWVITPTTAKLDAASLEVLARASDPSALQRLIATTNSGLTGPIDATGGLAITAAAALNDLTTTRVVATIPLVLFVLIASCGVSVLLRLLQQKYDAAGRLLTARGASTAQLFGRNTAVTVGTAALGGFAGLNFGALAISLFSGGPLSFSLLGATLVVALVTVIAALAAFNAAASARLQKARAAIAAITPLAAAVAAALSVWQLCANPGRLTLLGAASLPLAVFASTALLLILFVRALRSFPGGLGSQRVEFYLAGRNLRHRARNHVPLALIVALTAASCVSTGTLHGTLMTAGSATGSSQVGPDARLTLMTNTIISPGQDTAGTISALRSADGTRAIAQVLSNTAMVGRDRYRFLALPAGAVEALTGSNFLKAPSEPSEIGPPARQLEVGLSVSGSDRPGVAEALAWIAGDDGTFAVIPLGAASLQGQSSVKLRADLPSVITNPHLLALDVALSDSPSGGTVTVAVTDVHTTSVNGSTVDSIGLNRLSSTEVALSTTMQTGRVLVDPLTAPLIVTASAAAANQIGARKGDMISFTSQLGTPLNATIGQVVPFVPGEGRGAALATDEVSLARATLAAGSAVAEPNELWISTPEPRQVAAAAARVVTDPWSFAIKTGAASSPTSSISVGAAVTATVFGILISGLSIVVVLLATLRARRRLGNAQHALGLSKTQIRTALGTEMAVVAVGALTVGILSGSLSACLTAGSLAAAAYETPTVYAPAFSPTYSLPLLGLLLSSLSGGALAAAFSFCSRKFSRSNKE